MKNYNHNVIRLRKGKKCFEQVYWIIAILNKKKTKSLGIVHKLGFFRYGHKRVLSINYYKLAFFLNKGFILKKSVKNILKYACAAVK